MIRRLALTFAALTALVPAQNACPPTANPPVQKLDHFRYQIGGITLDQRSREIRLPTQVNMADGQIEYLIVMPQGKTHESLLTTTISPIHLNLAFTLLRYPASPELFYLLDANHSMTTTHPPVAAAVRADARIDIDVEWDQQGTTRRIPVNEWIQHVVTTHSMPAGPWLYTGSDIHDAPYLPETSGDIAAIMNDPGALINFPGSDNGDNVWYAFPKRIPPTGTPVTLIISPHSKTIHPPQP